MESVKIDGGTRAGLGKAATKVDRSSEAIPCVLYGGNENVHFTTTWNEVRHLIYTADFKTADITADGKNYSAIVKEVQFHPVSEKIAILYISALRKYFRVLKDNARKCKCQAPSPHGTRRLETNH